MKHKLFFIRLINLIAIVALIGIYQGVVVYRGQQEQIAKLTAESSTYQSQIAELQKEVTAAEKSSSGSSDSNGSSASSDSSDDSGYGFKDGTYTGSAQGFGGQISLSVKVSGGKITSIDINSASGEDASYFNQAKAIIQNIIDAQSPDVDTISGATYSSTGIKNAVIKALQKAQ